MKKNIQNILLITLVFSVLESCVSLSSHNLGRTVGEDNHSYFANFNLGHIDSKQYAIEDDTDRFYIVEAGALYGIEKNFDLGFKINSSSHFSGIGKFQYIGDEKSFFASSIGLDIGIGLFAFGTGGISYNSSVSLFNSIHPTDYLAFTFSPRYTYLGLESFIEEEVSRSNNIYGYSAGVIVGKKHQFSFELSQYVNNTKFTFDTKPIFGLGYIINIEIQ